MSELLLFPQDDVSKSFQLKRTGEMLWALNTVAWENMSKQTLNEKKKNPQKVVLTSKNFLKQIGHFPLLRQGAVIFNG